MIEAFIVYKIFVVLCIGEHSCSSLTPRKGSESIFPVANLVPRCVGRSKEAGVPIYCMWHCYDVTQCHNSLRTEVLSDQISTTSTET